MKTTIIALTTGIAFLLAAPVHAGGPIIIEEATEADRDNKVPVWIFVVLGVGVALAIAGNTDNCTTVEPVPPMDGGC